MTKDRGKTYIEEGDDHEFLDVIGKGRIGFHHEE